jgi:hypothetical protein
MEHFAAEFLQEMGRRGKAPRRKEIPRLLTKFNEDLKIWLIHTSCYYA